MSDYLEVKLMDYRDLPSDGKMYDRVVIVGMLEHVGRENYQLYLDCVSKVTKTGNRSAREDVFLDPWITRMFFQCTDKMKQE